MYNGLYLACMLSATTTATVMWWVLRQNLRAPRIAADQLPQRRLRDLQHLGKAFIVVPVTVLTEQYVYSTHDFAHQIRMLEGFQWLLGHGMWAFGFILVWDWAVRKTLQTNPHRLPALQRIAALCVCLYAVLSVFGLWYIQSTVPHSTARSAHEADLWKATERVAASLQNDPTYSLRVVNDHIDALFMSRRAPYELFEIGEQRGVSVLRAVLRGTAALGSVEQLTEGISGTCTHRCKARALARVSPGVPTGYKNDGKSCRPAGTTGPETEDGSAPGARTLFRARLYSRWLRANSCFAGGDCFVARSTKSGNGICIAGGQAYRQRAGRGGSQESSATGD